MRRRRRKPIEPGFAILRSDALWYAGGDSTKTFWDSDLRLSMIYDLAHSAREKIDTRLAIDCPEHTFEIVPVDQERVFRG